jgi:hypothetical protein
MRNQGLLIGALAGFSLVAGAALAQQAIPPQSPMSTKNSMNATGPTACASPLDPKSCNAKGDVVVVTTPSADVDTTTSTTTTTSPTRLYNSSDYSPGAVVSTSTVTNGPVPDTAENRARYGQPMSRAGKRTAPVGN